MTVRLIREDDEYRAEYVDPIVFYTGKSKQPIWTPLLIRITRKVDVKNWRTQRIYEKGSCYFLSVNCSPRVTWSNDLINITGSGDKGYANPFTAYSILQDGVCPQTYYAYFGPYWNGWFEHYFTIQYNSVTDKMRLKYANMKIVMCGCARRCSGTRGAGSGWSNIYANTGQPGVANEQFGLPVNMQFSPFGNTLSGVGASGIYPIKYTDYQRYAWVNSNSGMARTGKREGGASDSRWWTTQYWDEEDFYALGIRLK